MIFHSALENYKDNKLLKIEEVEFNIDSNLKFSKNKTINYSSDDYKYFQ